MVEEDEVYHICNDYKGSRDGRSIKITGIQKARSSYSVDRVEYRFMDNGETSSMSVDAFQKDLGRDRIEPGKAGNCSKCPDGGDIDG